MLRAIVNQSVQKTPLPEELNKRTNGGGKGSGGISSLKRDTVSSTKKKKNHPSQDLGDWENPQTFVVALERIEAWIFSRIVESVWWQVLSSSYSSSPSRSCVLSQMPYFLLTDLFFSHADSNPTYAVRGNED